MILPMGLCEISQRPIFLFKRAIAAMRSNSLQCAIPDRIL